MNGTTGGGSTIIMLVLMIAIFYFLLIRPESKRKKAAEQMRSNLKKGDTITTIGGIVGRIVAVLENTLIIETSDDRVRMEITKWAVSTTGVQSSTEPVKAKKEKKAAEESAAEETPAPESKTEELPADVVDEIPAPEEEPKD